jgi:hypothetical protein
MRDIRGIPTRISDVLYGGVSLDSAAKRATQRAGNLAERRGRRGANDAARPMLHGAQLQHLECYAGRHIHGPNSS